MIKELNTSYLRLTQTAEYARLGHNMPECGIICQHLCNGLSMGLAGWHICVCVGAWRPCRRTSGWRKWGMIKILRAPDAHAKFIWWDGSEGMWWDPPVTAVCITFTLSIWILSDSSGLRNAMLDLLSSAAVVSQLAWLFAAAIRLKVLEGSSTLAASSTKWKNRTHK